MPGKPISRRSFLTISAMTAATAVLDWGNIAAYAAKMGIQELGQDGTGMPLS